jgi:hypothetical protein
MPEKLRLTEDQPTLDYLSEALHIEQAELLTYNVLMTIYTHKNVLKYSDAYL